MGVDCLISGTKPFLDVSGHEKMGLSHFLSERSKMAFYPWSIPVFVAAVIIGFLVIVLVSRSLSRSARVIILVTTAIPLCLLAIFGWWVNQGEENDIGQQLFWGAWAGLFLIVIVEAIISFTIYELKHRSQG